MLPTAPLVNQIAELVEQRTGIAVRAQMRDALPEIITLLAGDDLAGYYQRLSQRVETDGEWLQLIDAVTIGETYFLRDQAHFDLLRERLLPEVIARRRQQDDLYLNIWSMGCASGEEPYSLAITLHELLPDIANWRIQLIGSDINAVALRAARRGVYRQWAFRHTDLDFQQTYFDPTPTGLAIKPHIRKMVSFRHANLFRPAHVPAFTFDFILTRNVLLYFDADHVQQAEKAFHKMLSPGGWLLLGRAEVIRATSDHWETHVFDEATAYRKPAIVRKVAFANGHANGNGHGLVNSHSNGNGHVNGNGHTNGNGYTNGNGSANGRDHWRHVTGSNNGATNDDYARAVQAVHREAFDEAENLLTRLLEACPRHALAHVLLASLLANRQQIDEAHVLVDAAVRLEPLLADAYYLRALLLLEQGRLDKARHALRTAIYCQRSHPLASFMLGNLHARAGEHNKANRYWHNARRAIGHLKPESLLSDISNISVGQLQMMVSDQLMAQS
jgi:chemotaxis protein methyltransferase CheR